MKNLGIFWFLVFLLFLPHVCYSSHWIRVYEGSNTFVKTFGKGGLCQIVYKSNGIAVGFISNLQCSNMQRSLLIEVDGELTKEDYFYNDSCSYKKERRVDLFKKYCLGSAQKELPFEIKQWLKKYKNL